PFADESFDFVHQRCVADQLLTPTWPMVARELARVTRPGGWIELVELRQHASNPGPATTRYLHWWAQWSARTGIYTSVGERLGELLQETGFGQVARRHIIAPVGSWGKLAGIFLITDLIECMTSMQQPFCTTLHLSPALFHETLEAFAAEWEAHHTAFHFSLVYGQKEG
ncbi:MAG: methyltransferase domain-containing protein, partial [Ktedonobacteraceae bacterium]